jgi:hypothetical protein
MPERRDFDPSNAPVYMLVQEVLRLRADLAIIAANVVQQAIEREWCDEYDQWARITNKQCSRPHMIQRNDWMDGDDATHQEPVLRDPDTGHPLDESGRFFMLPYPRPGVWCAACGVHH